MLSFHVTLIVAEWKCEDLQPPGRLYSWWRRLIGQKGRSFLRAVVVGCQLSRFLRARLDPTELQRAPCSNVSACVTVTLQAPQAASPDGMARSMLGAQSANAPKIMGQLYLEANASPAATSGPSGSHFAFEGELL